MHLMCDLQSCGLCFYVSVGLSRSLGVPVNNLWFKRVPSSASYTFDAPTVQPFVKIALVPNSPCNITSFQCGVNCVTQEPRSPFGTEA